MNRRKVLLKTVRGSSGRGGTYAPLGQSSNTSINDPSYKTLYAFINLLIYYIIILNLF